MPNTPGSWIGRTNYRLTPTRFIKHDDIPIGIKESRKTKTAWYECRCECGTIVYVASSNMGNTKSCGCLAKETSAKNGKKFGVLQKDRDVYLASIVYNSIKANARARGLSFNIDKTFVLSMLHNPCFYCGEIDKNTHNVARRNQKEALHYNGIDRVNPSIGYEKTNIVSCCGICNTAKLDLPVDEFKEWIMKIYEHMFGAT